MGTLRTKRAIRDRESGLVFSWRLPVGGNVRLGAALLTVGVVATGLAATVRVRIGEGTRPIERRASMVIVPSSPEWRALEMRALEAGPFPAKSDLSRDSAFVGARAAALRLLTPPGVVYEPVWREVPVQPTTEESAVDVMLPPLPVAELRAAAEPVGIVSSTVSVIGGAAKIESSEPPPPVTGRSRHLVYHLPDGRITSLVDLGASAGIVPGGDLADWWRGSRVVGGAAQGGWIAVEVSP